MFSTKKLCESQTKAVITLLPKKGELTNLANWRPISLLNTDYKILTKILANRLAKVMPFLVEDSQTCAVKNRQIHHHLLLI